MILYLPDGIYADLRTASTMRFQIQSELARVQNRISRWFNIYFSKYKTVYEKLNAISGSMILNQAPLPEDILTLSVDGVEPDLAGCQNKSSREEEDTDPDKSCKAQCRNKRRGNRRAAGNPYAA